MKRYQLYLNPHAVSILDDFKKISNISISKIMRSVADRVAEQLIMVVAEKRKSKKKYILDELAGFIDLKTNKKTNFAQTVDEIYFND